MNEEWIDKKLETLNATIGLFKLSPNEFFFEPTVDIYMKLGSGDEKDVQDIAVMISKHINIYTAPSVKYEWGLKMEPEVGAQIKLDESPFPIRIPFFFVGKKYATGSILAHEISHIFLLMRNIYLSDTEENEMLTDLTAVFIGLGKLLLNGLIVETEQNFCQGHVLGYLPLNLIFYSYKKVNALHSISEDLARKNLLPDVINKIKWQTKQKN